MNWNVLKNEIVNDPLSRGYSGMTNSQLAVSLNLKNRTRMRGVIPAHEIIDSIVPGEWSLLLTSEQRRIELITGAGEVNVQNDNVRAALQAAFGPGTTTRANLLAIQNELISRALELALPAVQEGDVAYARTL